MDYFLMIDSDIEIPYTYADEHDIKVFYMPYTIDGREEMFDLGRTTDYQGFYRRLREGGEAFTSTRSIADIQEFYEVLLSQGKDILYLSFSSKLSSHHELAHTAAAQALASCPERRIEIVDSLNISIGAGVLAYHACRQWETGASIDELKEWILANRMKAHCCFTVDSLQHLRRTGRLGAVSTTLGTILDLKPILRVSPEGKIDAFDKVRGRRRLQKRLCELIESNVTDDDTDRELCVINHADNPELAFAIRDYVTENMSFKHIRVENVGPVISIHAGVGVVGVAFMGKSRDA